MGNIFSNKSFMNRYFSAPKSTGPAKLTDLSGDGKVTQKDVLIGKGVLDAPKQPAKMQEQEGPAKRTRAERQADRDSKKTKRRGDRADKRVKRNEAKIDKLKKKVKDGKEVFNVDEAGNKTTGRKANRIKRDYCDEHEQEDFTKIKRSKQTLDLNTQNVAKGNHKPDLLTVRQIAAAKANKAKESEKNKKTINTKFEGGKIKVDLVKDSKKEESGPAKKGKTARSKEHQEKIHGKKPGYYDTKEGLVKVKKKSV